MRIVKARTFWGYNVHRRFMIFFFAFLIFIRHVIGLFRTKDQLVAKVFTDTEQHNI
jgi:hypothetical protein